MDMKDMYLRANRAISNLIYPILGLKPVTNTKTLLNRRRVISLEKIAS